MNMRGGHRGGFRSDVDVDSARRLKGLGPGNIVEQFDSKIETKDPRQQIKASEQISSVLNAKFLILVLILIVIGIVFYMLKNNNSI